MSAEESNHQQKITVTLSKRLVTLIDQLKREYGVRSRGLVLESVLEQLIQPEDQSELLDPNDHDAAVVTPEGSPPEASSLVLIRNTEADTAIDEPEPQLQQHSSVGIDLPGFVSRRTTQLRDTLSQRSEVDSLDKSVSAEPLLSSVAHGDLVAASQAVDEHWRSLYGQPPGDTVVEASMLWLARDVWSTTDASDGRPFTWSAANASMKELCSDWEQGDPSLGRVMVVAGALEDPFATSSLAERMPTLIRRFVNRFRRSRQVTSFETLESTMTVHGALKLLGLSTGGLIGQQQAIRLLQRLRLARPADQVETNPRGGPLPLLQDRSAVAEHQEVLQPLFLTHAAKGQQRAKGLAGTRSGGQTGPGSQNNVVDGKLIIPYEKN